MKVKTKMNMNHILILVISGLIFLIAKPISTGLVGSYQQGVMDIFGYIAGATIVILIYFAFISSKSLSRNREVELVAVFIAFLLIELANSFIRQAIEPNPIISIITGVIFCFLLLPTVKTSTNQKD